jgi:hypothetical protein
MYMGIARPNITAGWPERKPNQRYRLQTVSGEALPILKEGFLTMALGWQPLKIWVFVAGITEVIMALDILRVYDTSVELGRNAVSWEGRGTVMEPKGRALTFHPGCGQ